MYAMILDNALNFAWREVPTPVRKDGEVLIRVRAAAVNRADLMQKDGTYSSPADWPQWCGLEVSGEILEAGSESALKAGTKVCALLGGGGYSEVVAVPEGMVLPIPDGLDMVEAASLPEVWCTAYLNLKLEGGGLKPGDVCFIQAGASGVGLAAIQLAKSMGAMVITTVGSDEKAEIVRRFGADIAVNYHKEPLLPVLQTHPVTIALDCVAGKGMGDCLKCMTFCGRWIMIASLAGGKTEIDLETVWRKRIKIIGSTLRSRTSAEKTQILKALQQELWPLFSSRKLVSNIHAVFPIADVEQAHAVLRRNENVGKVVLTF